MEIDEYSYNFKLAEKTSKEEITDTFSTRTMSVFAKGVQQAYRWVENWIHDPGNEILVSYAWEKYTRGFVVGIAVNYFLIKEIQEKGLDLSFSFKYNSNNSYPYLVIFDNAGTFEMTVNQTQKSSRCASKANFRDNLINKYQSSLFSDMKEESEVSKKYFQLTHGYQTSEPGYINLGIPDEKGVWKDYVDISQLPQIRETQKLNSKPSEYQPINLQKMQDFVNEVVDDE